VLVEVGMNKPICKNGEELLVGCGKNSQNPFRVCKTNSIKYFFVNLVFWHKYVTERYSEDGIAVTRRKWYYAVKWFENLLLFTALIAICFGIPATILNKQPFFDLMVTWCMAGAVVATVVMLFSALFDAFSINNAN
jgi:uncharacterized membrane protein